MELHKRLNITDVQKPSIDDGIKNYFSQAREFVQRFYPDEIEYFSSIKFDDITPEFYFREYVWVVHATGFSAHAVGSFINRLTEAYGNWKQLAVCDESTMLKRVCAVVNNPKKILSVYKMAKLMLDRVNTSNWNEYKYNYLSTPELLQKLPYIGKVTCFHLARNIGLLEYVKPDLHLVRLAKHWGFKNCDDMCKFVQPKDMPLGIVDLIFWYAASTFGTLEIRKEGER
jgi:hypothetical protein